MAGLMVKSMHASGIVRKMRRGYIARISREFNQDPGVVDRTVHYLPYPYGYPPGAAPPAAAPQQPEKTLPDGMDIEGKTEMSSENLTRRRGDPKRLSGFNVQYSLIPRQPAQGEKVYAYANIRWDRRASELLYYVVEPEISQYDLDVIGKTKKLLEEKLDIDFFKLGEIKAKDLLREEAQRILGLDPNLDPEKVDSIRYYLERDIVGMGKIEPLMNDPNIEDISCDGINIPIYVYHRNPDIGSLKTNVTFRSSDELNSFVVKIAQRCKKSISIAEPLLDAALPDGSRIQATLETDIARRGSNFTIRKFAEQPLTPSHMLRYGTLDSTQLAYLWLAIDNGQSILISGGTATGKTSLLNALSLFIRPTLKIVSIEDTPELRLPHPHWIPEVARTPLSIKGSVGDVSLFDLLKSSLRQRPDYIVMGEVRGKEAFVLFQQMATGHPSLATIHAASINQLVDRLTTPPISLPPSLIENINVIVFLSLSRHSGRYIRRTNKILEVTGIENDRPRTSDIFVWKPATDEFKIGDKSVVLKSIAERLGLNDAELRGELARRRIVVEWMYKQGIFDYREVAKIISAYYNNPEKVMEAIGRNA